MNDALQRKIIEFLDLSNTVVEDWYCGSAYRRQFFAHAEYRGVDVTGPIADVVIDPRNHQTDADSILLFQCLDRPDWRLLLTNALEFRRRLVIVFELPPVHFTPGALSAVLYGLHVRIEFRGNDCIFSVEREENRNVKTPKIQHAPLEDET